VISLLHTVSNGIIRTDANKPMNKPLMLEDISGDVAIPNKEWGEHTFINISLTKRH
jgi:hypothetical protein